MLCAVLAAVLMLAAHFAPAAESEAFAPYLQSYRDVSINGSYRLWWRWKRERGDDFELQESPDPLFGDAQVVYRGDAAGTTILDRPDGTYHYRVRAIEADGRVSAWSNMVAMHVYRNPMVRAYGFILSAIAIGVALLIYRYTDRRRERPRD